MNAAAIKQAGLWDSYTDYAKNDADQCANIWKELVDNRQFPVRELVLMDKIIRCAIEPKFQLDQNVLALHLAEVRARKEALMARINFTREDLLSNDKFAMALATLGVTPPRKISLLTGSETWAFSKTDPDFIELEEHPDPDVQALVSARLGLKTTLEETRTEKFLQLSRLQWPDNKSWLPVPLRYSGAHTHRLSGEWKLNLQNLPRGGALRRAITAPEGYMVIAPDSSQIEARINAWLGDEHELLDGFRRGADIYSEFASEVFGYPVNKKMKKERFLGKTSILGLGYGMGWAKFQTTVKLQSRAQLGEEIILSDYEAQRIVSAYRNKYRGIALSWKIIEQNGVPKIVYGGHCLVGPITFMKDKIALPSGLHLHYPNLQYDNKDRKWMYKYAGRDKVIYGPKFLENIVQALARIVVMDAALVIETRFKDELSYPVGLAMQVHDELVYVVKEDDVERAVMIASEEMARPPVWAKDLPLASECDVGKNYGEAK
jgi:DNA polymerase